MRCRRSVAVAVCAAAATTLLALLLWTLGVGRQSHADDITARGVIPITLLSKHGPVEPRGPFAATSLDVLTRLMRLAQHGDALVCRPGPCWGDARVPTGSLLIVLSPGTTVWDTIRELTTAMPDSATLQIDVVVANGCDRVDGSGQRQRGRDVLLAVPLARLPPGAPRRVVLRVPDSTRGFRVLGVPVVANH